MVTSNKSIKRWISFICLAISATSCVQGSETTKSLTDYQIADKISGNHGTFSPQGNYFAYMSKENQLIVSRKTVAEKIDKRQIERLFGELDSDNFNTRNEAYKQLLQYGSRIADEIANRVKKPASPEMQERLKAIHTSLKRSSQRKNTRRVRQVVFSPDEQTIAVAGDDRKVWLWRTASLSRERVIGEFDSAVHSLAFSPDGHLLAIGTGDGKIIVIDRRSADSPVSLEGHTSSIPSLTFSPNSKTLISAGGFDRRIGVWDLSEFDDPLSRNRISAEWLRGHHDSVLAVVISPDGLQMASAGYEKTILLWDFKTLQQTDTLSGHENTIRFLEYRSNGKVLLSAGDGQHIKLWNPTSKDLIFDLHLQIPGIHKVSRRRDSREIAISGRQNEITILKSDAFF